MARPQELGFYVTLDLARARAVAPRFVESYFARGEESEDEWALRLLEPLVGGDDELRSRIVDPVAAGKITLVTPSADFASRLSKGDVAEDERAALATLERVVLSFRSSDPELLEAARERAPKLEFFDGLGSDLPFDAVEHWCPGAVPDHQFGDRAAARRLIGWQRLVEEQLTGTGVNVVIVDRGLDAAALGGSFGGGWRYCPKGRPPCIEPGGLVQVPGVTDNDHGMMVARNVLGVAAGVTLLDLPLLPARIAMVSRFLSDAQAAFEWILSDVRLIGPREPGERWVLVNAWSIFDRSGEQPPGDYSANPRHPFNRLISALDRAGVDTVFATGNCGQFCPDARCGPHDIGPGRSLHGANAHPAVLTVGAARSDGLWVGSSSQGPGPAALAAEKPDLVAPSLFSEIHDRRIRNGGSSAACAAAAGVLAALRQRWPASQVPPAALRQALRQSARRSGPPGWDERLGWGVIDADRAVEGLSAAYP